MIYKDYLITMANYNEWMNRKLYDICSNIPDDKRKKNMGAFFKSIHGTLNHLLYGDKAWMGRFIGKPFEISVIGKDLYDNFDDLYRERINTDQKIIDWTQTLSIDWLKSDFEYTSNVDNKTRILPTWILVTHMFNHQTHHRGQLTTLIKQLGFEPGITDLPWLPNNN